MKIALSLALAALCAPPASADVMFGKALTLDEAAGRAGGGREWSLRMRGLAFGKSDGRAPSGVVDASLSADYVSAAEGPRAGPRVSTRLLGVSSPRGRLGVGVVTVGGMAGARLRPSENALLDADVFAGPAVALAGSGAETGCAKLTAAAGASLRIRSGRGAGSFVFDGSAAVMPGAGAFGEAGVEVRATERVGVRASVEALRFDGSGGADSSYVVVPYASVVWSEAKPKPARRASVR